MLLLPRKNSLVELTLSWELSSPDELLKKTGECIEKCGLKHVTFYFYSPSFLSEEAVKVWVQRVIVGGKCLVRTLECSQVLTLGMNIYFNDMSFTIDENGTQAQLHSSIQETEATVNSESENKFLPSPEFEFNIFNHITIIVLYYSR